ncbi:hypothetical protein M513_10448 [Trichuris suis]|uniref:Uncharacterized protein n=1 Tax=Trichuris suis TaxID=68888 RepID=A0A085LUL8_9BILA|nr:hypothetical protein M513_10448 [Trichuris suis]
MLNVTALAYAGDYLTNESLWLAENSFLCRAEAVRRSGRGNSPVRKQVRFLGWHLILKKVKVPKSWCKHRITRSPQIKNGQVLTRYGERSKPGLHRSADFSLGTTTRSPQIKNGQVLTRYGERSKPGLHRSADFSLGTGIAFQIQQSGHHTQTKTTGRKEDKL